MNTLPALTRRRAASLFTDESGAATAEYAITTIGPVSWCTRHSAACRSREARQGTRAPVPVSAR